MADKIDRPGLYALSRETYHGSSTIEPSLSSSGAVTLVQECPAVFWASSPLNPDFVPEQKLEFDIGSAAHLIILEPAKWGSQVVEIDADNYKTKAAQEARDAGYAAGKTPLLPKHRRTIRRDNRRTRTGLLCTVTIPPARRSAPRGTCRVAGGGSRVLLSALL